KLGSKTHGYDSLAGPAAQRKPATVGPGQTGNPQNLAVRLRPEKSQAVTGLGFVVPTFSPTSEQYQGYPHPGCLNTAGCPSSLMLVSKEPSMTIQVDDSVDFRALTDAQLYDLLHGTLEELQNRAAEEPTQDLLEQS